MGTFPLPFDMAKWEDLLKAFIATIFESRNRTAEKTEAVDPFANFLIGLNLLWKSF